MIKNLDFFVPVKYDGSRTFIQSIIEGIDDFFYFGGKRAYVIAGKTQGNSYEVEIREDHPKTRGEKLLNGIKIAAALTGVIFAAMLILKTISRGLNHYHFKIIDQTRDSGAAKVQQVADPIISSQSSANSPDIDKPKPVKPEPVKSEPVKSETSKQPGSTAASLMERFTAAWDSKKAVFNFDDSDFNVEKYGELLSSHAEKFRKEGINDTHFGYIEKFDLNPSENPQIYVRADLHGDLKSLIENLRSLQKEGLLDENYKCKPGVHLIVLGDYCDRGIYGTQILELLMRLREENPEQVHLIRGNHESLYINNMFGGSDSRLMKVINNDKARDALLQFYQSMSLTTYFGLKDGPNREYIQCTHGLFEPSMDPAPLLDNDQSTACIPVPTERKLSERIKKLEKSTNPELAASAKRVDEIVQQSTFGRDWGITAYNWADVTPDSESWFGSLGSRTYKLSAQDIRHYLNVSSELHQVKMIFRGHEHGFQHLMHEGKVIVTTLPVGMDCPGYQNRFDQPDRAYILKPAAKVSEWQKRALLREKTHNLTDSITTAEALSSSAI